MSFKSFHFYWLFPLPIAKSPLHLVLLWGFVALFSTCFSNTAAVAQTRARGISTEELKKMSLEELMGLEVTTVSKRPEKLTEVASAIQVITEEDIRRSAATSLPELLRLVTNLQVTQLNSSAHIISSRGFNAAFSNKLLVMIDGRTVYSPLFAGVFWDAQQVVLEDIAQIEVVSGPGGTLWGANAVNGVINIITKSSKETQGLLASVSAGSHLRNSGTLRYGGEISPNLSYRIYAQHSTRDHTFLPDGMEAADKWRISNGGFRLDWTPSTKNSVTLQGNSYGGKQETLPSPSFWDGQNILSRWTHTFTEHSGIMVQAYFDRTWRRDIPSTIDNELYTYDLELQHYFTLGEVHRILWGGGYRSLDDHSFNSTDFIGILPNERHMNLISLFVQDEIMVHPELLLTLGTKIQHNDFTGIEIQPSTRLTWNPEIRQTIWTAISRAVRTPSRIDVDYYLPVYPVPSNAPSVQGGPNFVSEKVVAYELGYRFQPDDNITLSLASFFNSYDDLYSVDVLPGTMTYQIQNGSEGQSWGLEASGTWQLSEAWRMKGGYTYFDKDLQNKPESTYDVSALGNDAKHQGLLTSNMNLPSNFQLDLSVRYLGELPEPLIQEYVGFDARIAWAWEESVELSVVGQNIGRKKHIEILNQIPRSLYAKVTCRF